ncbi:MAG: hypothetical protein NVS3B12_05150 [Acidimicrobiales bacterium]
MTDPDRAPVSRQMGPVGVWDGQDYRLFGGSHLGSGTSITEPFATQRGSSQSEKDWQW